MPRCFPVVLACLASAAVLAAEEPAKKPKKPRPGPDVLVVSDVGREGRAFAPPTAESPAYYVLLGSLERDLGASVAGEKMPPKDVLERKVVDALATQHYLPTAVGGPRPSLALVISYGTANPEIHEWENFDSGTGESSTQSLFLNRREIALLVGAHKISHRLPGSSEVAEINQAASDDRIYVFVAAMDAEALRQKKKRLVWRTSMSIPSIRTNLPASLDVLLASAAPHFGRDSGTPLFVDDVDRRQGEVIIDPTEVIGIDETRRTKERGK